MNTGTVHWFREMLAKSQDGMVLAGTIVSPGLAEYILQFNESNRLIREGKVQQYASDIVNGRWADNGETLIISKCGYVNDGQHRLKAIVAAKKPQMLSFIFGVDRKTRTTIDQGSAKTASDYMSMRGEKNAVVKGAAARIIMAYQNSKGNSISGFGSFSPTHVLEWASGDELLEKASHFAASARVYCRMLPPSLICASYYILACVEDESSSEEYMKQVCYGENLERGDPAFAVRQYLLSHKMSRYEKIECVFRGWNSFIKNNSLSRISILGGLPKLNHN